jgi:hypothetical protein
MPVAWISRCLGTPKLRERRPSARIRSRFVPELLPTITPAIMIRECKKSRMGLRSRDDVRDAVTVQVAGRDANAAGELGSKAKKFRKTVAPSAPLNTLTFGELPILRRWW